ncbi:MAG TPA: DUF4922 domain-containing protein, partial [Blastocatellia bacterium]|nr:DUF4922 domain-containing protein [Blastocatellia bacterium]
MMNWDQRIICEIELSAHRKGQNGRSLPARISALVEQQKQSWPLLASGYSELQEIETKRLQIEETTVVVQYNPRRIRSTSASVDRASVEARGCFLCPERLPPEEKGIAYGDDLIILCNPFPILDSHLSIVHRQHVPQRIEGSLERLLDLACDLGPDFFVLYNGPECGASAPDHLHFQACSRSLLPIYSDLGIEEASEHCQYCAEMAGEGFDLFTLDGCGRAVIVYRGNRSDEIARWVNKTLARLPAGSLYCEPLINIVCTYESGMWTLLLFPR